MSTVEPPRYLVSFHPKRIVHRFTDVLVLGGGLAGLRAALAVDPALEVLVATKEDVRQSNSQFAQGGIAAVWDPADCFESHTRDTLVAGKGLCDEEVVELVVREAPLRIKELIEWGADFDRAGDELALGREGGHSTSRILHAMGDSTGREIMRVILENVAARPNIQVIENTFLVDLLTDEGRCVGALVHSAGGGIGAIWARETILATGGCGQLYRETTNPRVATGDGLAVAYRAGVRLQDMEFMQFHPTVLYVAGAARFLISEAVRGEGAYLRDRNGERFMPDCDPLAELAPRDTVARAIVRQMTKTQHPCVYLDQSHLDADRVRQRFPGIRAACEQLGLDIAKDLIPVRPGAHYMVGGLRTDRFGRTTLPGLWACGEAASTGLHGANRLASNSLLEALVFGQICGTGAGAEASAATSPLRPHPIQHRFVNGPAQELDLQDIRNSLRSSMFRNIGIERDQPLLAAALEDVDFWSQYVLNREFDSSAGWELQNMLVVAGLMARSALERTESRGTHFRADYPQTDDLHWRCRLVTQWPPFRLERVPVAVRTQHH